MRITEGLVALVITSVKIGVQRNDGQVVLNGVCQDHGVGSGGHSQIANVRAGNTQRRQVLDG
jgi:hypothetical protein